MGPSWKMSLFLTGFMAFSVEAGGLYMGPYFPEPLPTNITVHQDTVAYLPCIVKQLGDKSVSWIRQRDADILTVDRYTFVRDERLTVHYMQDTETWTLVIKYVQERDAGSYECQISTEPKMSKLVHLNVIVPQVEVLGDVDKYVRKGSTARLECMVSSTVQLPDYIFWYHSGERLLEYDHPRARISVSRRGGQGSEMSITSTLVITKAQPSDDGNYTCLPSNLHSASTILHVLNDEHPAAMQTGAAMLTDPPSMWGIISIVLLAFIFVHCQQNFSLTIDVNSLGKRTQKLRYQYFNVDNNFLNTGKEDEYHISYALISVCDRTTIDLISDLYLCKIRDRINQCFSKWHEALQSGLCYRDYNDTEKYVTVKGSATNNVYTSKSLKTFYESLQISIVVLTVSCISVLTYDSVRG